MDSGRTVFFCATYLLFFYMIGSIIGVVQFPPPPFSVDIWGKVISISFENMAFLMTVIVTTVVVLTALTIKVFGSGVDIDVSYVATLAIALAVGGFLAWLLGAIMPAVPIMVTAILVWPFIIALVYGVVAMARGGG